MRTFFLRGPVAAFAARPNFELTWDNPFPSPMGLSDTASEDTPLGDKPFKDMPAAEGASATTEMTSQKRTASTMNLSRLLRTALLSVLGLFLAGGLMTVQAQVPTADEEITVDQDARPVADETEITQGISTLNTNLSGTGGTAVGRLVVFAGDYTPTDADIDLGTNTGNIDELIIEVRRDDADNTDQLTIESLNLQSSSVPTTTFLESTNGDGFLQIQGVEDDGSGINNPDSSPNTGFDLALQNGDLNLVEADVLRFPATSNSNDVRIYRADGSSITGEAPNYLGDVDLLEYDAEGAGTSFSAGNELGTTSLSSASISRFQTLVIDDGVAATDITGQISFGVGTLEVGTFTQTDGRVEVEGDFDVNGPVATSDDVTVTGTLTSGGNVTVNSGDALNVDGTLEIEGQNTLTANGTINNDDSDVNGNGDPTDAGDLSFVNTINRSSTSGTLIDVGGSSGVVFNSVTVDVEQDGGGGATPRNIVNDFGSAGTFEVGGDFSVNVSSDGDGDDDTMQEILRQGAASTFVVNNVDVQSVTDAGGAGGFTDKTAVRVRDATVTPNANFQISGELDRIVVNEDGVVKFIEGSEKTTITGEIDNNNNQGGTVTVAGDVDYEYGTSNSPILNEASGSIDIEDGATLNIKGGSNSGTVLQNNGNPGEGVTASGPQGTGTLKVTGDNTYDITTTGGTGDNFLPNVTASAPLNIEDGGAVDDNIEIDGKLDADAAVTFADGGGSGIGDVTVRGNLDADGNVSLNATTDNVTVEGTLTAGTNDVSTGSGSVVDFSNATDGSDPQVTFEDDVTVNADPPGTELDISGAQEVEFQGNLTRAPDPNAVIDDGSSTTLAFRGTEATRFNVGSKFTLQGNVIVRKTDVDLTISEAVAIEGDLDIKQPVSPAAPNQRLVLEDNLFLSGGSDATVTINSEIVDNDNFFIVDGDGSKTFERTNGSNTLENLRVDDPNTTANVDAVYIGSNLEFAGTIELVNGGLEIDSREGTNGGSSNIDFAPAANSDAKITRFVDGSNTGITEDNATTNGEFNIAGNSYDVTYTTNGATSYQVAQVDEEFSGDVENLTVEAFANPFINSASKSGLTIGGKLTIEPDGLLSAAGGNRSLILGADNVTHSIEGVASGVDDLSGGNIGEIDFGRRELEVELAGDDATLEGSTDDNHNSIVQNLVVSGSNSNVSNLQRIAGDLIVEDGASVNSLSLSNANDDDFDGDGEGDARIGGKLTVNGTLTLGSDVEVDNPTSSSSFANDDPFNASRRAAPAVQVDGSGSNGTLKFASSDLFLTGGNSFDGNSDATYESSGGALILNEDDGSDIGTAGVSIPRVQFLNDGGAPNDFSVDEGVAVGERLRIDGATVTIDSDSLSFSGSADLQNDASVEEGTNDGELISKGTTVTLESAADVDKFVVDSDASQTEITDEGNGFALTIDKLFEVRSGSLLQNADIDLSDTNDNGTTFAYGTDAGAITRNSGEFDFTDGSSNDITFTLGKKVTVPVVRVSNNTNFGDSENFAVGDSLTLAADFNFDGNNVGQLEITGGTTITRTDDDLGNDVLDEAPVFPSSGTYSLFYDDNGNSGSPLNTGLEVDDAAGTIADIEVDDSNTEIEFSEVDGVSGVVDNVTGSVTVNGTLTLDAGTAEHGDTGGGQRQIEMANESTVLVESGSFEADSGDDNVLAHANNGDTYTLRYSHNGNGSDAARQEFIQSGDINLVTNIDDQASTGPGIDVLPGNRTVQSLTVNNGLDDNTNLREQSSTDDAVDDGGANNDPFELTVEGPVDINGGDLIRGNGVDVAGNTTVANGELATDIATEGNISFDSGGSIDDTQNIRVEFNGSTQALALDGDEAVDELVLNQTTAGDEEVTLSGGALLIGEPNNGTTGPTGVPQGSGVVDFINGVMKAADDAGDDVFVALNDATPNTGTFQSGNIVPPADLDRTNTGDNLSHFALPVQAGVTSGTPGGGGNAFNQGSLVFPTGTVSEFRPGQIIFTTDDKTEDAVNFRVEHIDEDPQGDQNLGNIADVGSYVDDQYWSITASSDLGESQTFDLALETSTGGEGGESEAFVDEFNQASELRLIRRFGDVANDWILQGTGDASYDNSLDTRDEEGVTKEFANVRTNSQSGLTSSGALFAIALPPRGPVVRAASDDRVTFDPGQTVDEGTEFTADLIASTRNSGDSFTADDLTVTATDGDGNDISDDLGLGSEDITKTVGSEAPADSVGEVTVSFTPPNSFVSPDDEGSRDFDLTLEATNGGETDTESFAVTVNDNVSGPEISGLTDKTVDEIGRSAPVFPDVAPEDTIEVTATTNDPGSGDVTFSTSNTSGSGLAEIVGDPTKATDENGEATATVLLTPGFDQAGPIGDGNEITLTVTATDEGIGQDDDADATVTVEFDREIGDVDGDGETRAADARDALDIAVGNQPDGQEIIPAQRRAADFNEDGDVRAGDALAILNDAVSGGSSVAAATASSASGSAGGAIYLGDPEVDGDIATYPVMLSEDASGVNAADVTLSVDQGEVKAVETKLSGDWMSAQNTTDDGTVKLAIAGRGNVAGQQVATVAVKTTGDASGVKPGGEYRLNGNQAKELEVRVAPDEFALNGSYPNPVTSSGQATIEMDLPSRASVTVEVYNVLGQRVQTLEQSMTAGEEQSVKVDASALSSGQYFYRVNAELEDGSKVTETRQMTVVR